MILNLSDGTNTTTLSGTSPVKGCTYFPATSSNGVDVTEAAEVILTGTAATIRATVNDIEQLLAAAAMRQNDLSAKVYVNYNPINSGNNFRSELLDGRVVWSENPGLRRLGDTSPTVAINVIWKRRAKWQDAETELACSSSETAETTGGVVVYNNDNASAAATNWVNIAANRIAGTSPAPVRIKITNDAGVTLSWRNFYIGNNVFSTPASADVWLLGSEAESPGASQTWAGAIDHSDRLWTIAIPSTLLGQAQGRRFRVIAAYTSLSNVGHIRASIGTWIGGVYGAQQIGDERLASSTGKLIDLGLFSIPPGGYNVANAAAALVISGRSSLAGSGTLDFVQLMPTDSFRHLKQIGYSCAHGDSIVDDGIDGGTYYLSGTSKYPIVAAYGAPLYLYPERANKLHILFEENGTFTAGRKFKVQLYTRATYDSI